MRQTRIKMCGMTRVADVQAACRAGADTIGMIFYAPSPRAVSLAQAQQLASVVSLGVARTTLFVDADAGFINEAIAAAGADILQFHGNESPEFCQQFGKRYIKAIRVKDTESLLTQLDQHQQADAILLDAYVAGTPGGTGQSFDWSLVPAGLSERLFLAGGLSADNVFQAIAQLRPYAVDVAGGIEIEKGIKSVEKIERFIAEVRRADAVFNEISS